jgi:hypothetical protein
MISKQMLEKLSKKILKKINTAPKRQKRMLITLKEARLVFIIIEALRRNPGFFDDAQKHFLQIFKEGPPDELHKK